MINLSDIVARVDLDDLNEPSPVDDGLPVKDIPEDCIEAIERIVNTVGDGDVHNVVIASGPSWDKIRLSVATDSKYVDRCRVHPYFQDLLGQSYDGKVFE